MNKRRTVLLVSIAVAAAIPATALASTLSAHLGHALTLEGNSGGERMSIKPGHLKRGHAGEFSDVPAGSHLDTVEITLKNVGSKDYSDSPSNGANLVTAKGRTIQTTFEAASGCDDPGSLKIPRHQSRVVCLTFQVSDASKIRFFEFTLDSGFADQTGEWKN